LGVPTAVAVAVLQTSMSDLTEEAVDVVMVFWYKVVSKPSVYMEYFCFSFV